MRLLNYSFNTTDMIFKLNLKCKISFKNKNIWIFVYIVAYIIHNSSLLNDRSLSVANNTRIKINRQWKTAATV